jgi:hypothetical protein
MSTASTTAVGVPAGVQTHPLYQTWAPIWRKLAHVYEGTGGFLDGTYLVAHPREWKDYQKAEPTIPTKKLLARRELARYENIAETLIDTKRSALFRGAVTRQVGDGNKSTPHPLELWWQNVDAAGTGIDDWMALGFTASSVFGHAAHIMDRPAGEAPATNADEKAPYLRLYSPLDITDWLTDDRGNLTAIKLLEAIPRMSLKTAFSALDVRERIITETDFEVMERGARTDGAEHKFGCLPVVLQYAKRRSLTQVIGQSILKDPQLYIDDYNLTSEIRALLRDQTFGLLNVILGTGDQATAVETALAMMGDEKSADNVVFTPGAMQYVQPDTGNVVVYQEERKHLVRTIFRLAQVPWESDSRDAEAEGSLKLKREDMNTVLASYADECERAEYAIAERWYRATYGADRGPEQMEKDGVVIRYPDTFDVTPFAEILEQAQAAISLEMGPTFYKELKCRLVAKFLPDATPGVISEIEKEIEQLAKEAGDPQTLITKAKQVLQKYAVDPEAQAA